MIDWGIAQTVAGVVAGGSDRYAARARPDDLDRRAEDLARRVCAYTGLFPVEALPRPEVVDRRSWIAANHESMRPLLDPVMERVGSGLGPLSAPVSAVTGALLGAQVGLLTGLLAQRVLGQYELALLDATGPARVLLIAPNLCEAAVTLHVDHDELVTWVTAHEVTHAVQFGSVSWLRGHVGGLLRLLLDSLDVSVAPGALVRRPEGDDVRGLVDAVRHGDVLRFMLGPERQDLLDRVQAVMSLIEGHAEHVMDAVGAEVVPSLDRLRAALTHRRETRSTLWRLLERLLGLDMKLRQYEVGRTFCDAVVERGGMPALNRAWDAPQALPTLTELHDPAAWLNRTHVPLVTKSGS
jgi:coenzyme F420 biosynthesis associated uncharacterized protein